jgi:hypothetical protein
MQCSPNPPLTEVYVLGLPCVGRLSVGGLARAPDVAGARCPPFDPVHRPWPPCVGRLSVGGLARVPDVAGARCPGPPAAVFPGYGLCALVAPVHSLSRVPVMRCARSVFHSVSLFYVIDTGSIRPRRRPRSGSHIYFFLAEEAGGIKYDWQLAGPLEGSEYSFWSFCNTSVCTGTLYCVLIAIFIGRSASVRERSSDDGRI